MFLAIRGKRNFRAFARNLKLVSLESEPFGIDAESARQGFVNAFDVKGKIIQARLRKWVGILPEDLDAAIQFGPAINTGVMAFCKGALIFKEWHDAAEQGRDQFIPDEVSCQMMLHRHSHCILDGRWNRSCRHDDPDLPDTRIIHYHGRMAPASTA